MKPEQRISSLGLQRWMGSFDSAWCSLSYSWRRIVAGRDVETLSRAKLLWITYRSFAFACKKTHRISILNLIQLMTLKKILLWQITEANKLSLSQSQMLSFLMLIQLANHYLLKGKWCCINWHGYLASNFMRGDRFRWTWKDQRGWFQDTIQSPWWTEVNTSNLSRQLDRYSYQPPTAYKPTRLVVKTVKSVNYKTWNLSAWTDK